MTESKTSRFWLMPVLLLVTIIIAGSVLIWLRRSPGQTIEILAERNQGFSGNIYIGGAVTNPGLYPFAGQDSINSLIQSAGGTADNADPGTMRLFVAETSTGDAQKIDINRADAWLLEALPGVGETLAHRIVDYREKNGPFRSINDLLKVAGLGNGVLQQIKDKITVVGE